ncbi:hypothetical protein H1R16_08710 [Marnyiella aurantia]|uniref:DUF4595 domain-containing protein n=1 Tax=Marnyiella aurantia TaxID=2758037 RepID=A0A7D7LQM8_9FLAO|nr:hypothetical protein [Marnyiella aurantia]MBA5246857.1 hypothetical protein [Marnyiella aurantia]QMS97798.1 hypothetical protein H1R16_08710 [Marnyiella aurantia]
MKRLLQFFSLIIGLAVFNSCAESDPAAVYGFEDPNDISGPRILRKAFADNSTLEDYSLNNGKLFKIDRVAQAGATVENQTIYVYYLGNRISKMEMIGTVPGGTTGGKYVLIPNYDNATGRMVSLMNDFYVGNTHTNHSISIFEYDGAGRVTKAYKKTAAVNPATPNIYVYPNTVTDAITYDGPNVAKVESSKNVLDISSGVILSTVKNTYEYVNYDWRNNPYLGISDNYIINIASIFPDMYSYMSDNNPAKMKFTSGSLPMVETVYSYKFDTHNYPVSNGTKSYTYQPAPQ